MNIAEVLEKMSRQTSKTFSIKFIRANKGRGGVAGSIKSIDKARKGYPNPKIQEKRPNPEATTAVGGQKLHKDAGTIPMYNTENMAYPITPHISHIIEFNGIRVKH